MAEKVALRIGVWEENGNILRRDSQQEPFPQVYCPKTPGDVPTILNVARQLHTGVLGGSFWGTQGERVQDDLVSQLRTKILS